MTQTNEIREAAEFALEAFAPMLINPLMPREYIEAIARLTKAIEDDDFRIELEELVAALIPEIGDEYRATGDEDDEDAGPSMDLTIGYTPANYRKWLREQAYGPQDDSWDHAASWGYQTGDNSYTGGAYSHPHWAVVYLERDSDPVAVAKEIQEQIAEAIHGC